MLVRVRHEMAEIHCNWIEDSYLQEVESKRHLSGCDGNWQSWEEWLPSRYESHPARGKGANHGARVAEWPEATTGYSAVRLGAAETGRHGCVVMTGGFPLPPGSN